MPEACFDRVSGGMVVPPLVEIPNDEETEAMEEDVVGVSWYSLGFFEEKQPMAAVFLELDPHGAEEALAAGNEQKRHLTVAFETLWEVAVDSKRRAPLARIWRATLLR